jgi:DNA processing protein
MPTAPADHAAAESRSVSQALGRALNEIEAQHAPPVLFGAGDWSLLQGAARVSVVGSRKVSEAGRRRAASLAAWLVRNDFLVVSGLAEGVDTAAHQTAIDEGGRTIGVIGTPLQEAFPAKNRDLQRFMATHHLVVSQFPSGTKVLPGNFPRRNRTMALLSHATVIVEAKDGSGTFHQGWEALRLGRPLFIPQSCFDDATLKWPQEFVRFGACVLSEDDWEPILDYLPDTTAQWSVDFGG